MYLFRLFIPALLLPLFCCASFSALTNGDASQRIFDFRSGTFCFLKIGAGVSSAERIFGKPSYEGEPLDEEHAARYDKRYLFQDVEIHCRNGRIRSIASDTLQIRTDLGLKRGAMISTINELYGEPTATKDGNIFIYKIGKYTLTIFCENNCVDRLEVCVK